MTSSPTPDPQTPDTVVKPTPPEQFIHHGTDREMRIDALPSDDYLVPNDRFFVRNQHSTPRIDPATWKLRVEGDGIERSIELTYDELLRMGAVSEVRALECAGNGRSLFAEAIGAPIAGTQWKLGGIGVAEWTGVPLRDVLALAGVKPEAVQVVAEGIDDAGVARPIPIEKALAPDTILAYAMNGETLPPDHGYPLRLIVPGWAGIANVKWLGALNVSTEPVFTLWNTMKYVLVGPDWEPQHPAPGKPVDEMGVKSAFTLARDAELPAGPVTLHGRAWSAHGSIARVEVSTDGGQAWADATLHAPNLPQAWVRWEFGWNATPGRHTLLSRATDERGNCQPTDSPRNQDGYLFCAIVSHLVTVTSP